jgi:O-antigen/teichoic acid export membrane protein
MTTGAQPSTDSAQLRSLARGGALNLVASAFGAITGIGLVVIVTRGLSPTDAGVFFTATSIFLVVARICELGSSTGLVYFLSRSRALGRPEQMRSWLRAGLVPIAVVSVVLSISMIVAAPALARLFDQTGDSAAADVLRLLAVFVPVAAVNEAFLGATRGTGTMRTTALLEQIARPTLQMLLILLAIAAGTRPELAWALPYVPAALVAGVWLRRRVSRPAGEQDEGAGAGGGAAGRRSTAAEFWRFTAPRSVTSIAQIALQRLDIILIAAILGPVEAALYTAATRFLVVGQLAGQSLTLAVQPKLAAALARRDLGTSRTLYQTSTCWLVLVAWPLYLSFAVLAPHVLRLFGPQYTTGATVVVILMLTMLVATGCGTVDSVLYMAGRTLWHLGNVLLALAVNVTVDLLLIPQLGIEGAAIGWAAAILVNNLLPLGQVIGAVRLHPLGAGSLTAMALALACFGLLPGAALLLNGQLPWVVVALFVGAVLYVGGCWRFRRVLDVDALLAVLPGRWSTARPIGSESLQP